MDLDEIKRGLRAEIKKRENEQYFTFQCNVRQMCKDVLAKLEEQESEIAELKDKSRMHDFFWEGCGFKRRGFKNSIEVSEAYDFLEEENAQLKESIAVYQRNEKLDIREIRHHKYKRCLMMANMCESNVIWVKGCSEWRRWKKWHKRWLELAERFK